ncbi:MAG TPA: heavy metal-binding domain-containing protein [Isosphaeraceae bacterium]|nr:heavy metal-binding domain-containing protein [Isosphaeraceae bacterium]
MAGRQWLPWVWRVVSVRFRFLIVLALAFLVVTQWEVIRTYWDKVTLGALRVDPASQAVSADTEYFCPMDPGVVSDWPGKCGVCNMALVRRKRGDVGLLPDGVVARMQFSPYRLQLGGVRTAPVGYRALVREVEGPGKVLAAASVDKPVADVEMRVFASEVPGLGEGQAAVVSASGSEPLKAAVRSIEPASDSESREVSVRLDVTDPLHQLRAEMPVRAQIQVPVAGMEPFRSMPKEPPPLGRLEKRRVYRCAEHADVVRDAPGRCPRDQAELEPHELAANQRLRWWCPMHPNVVTDASGSRCEECGGMKLVPTVITFSPPGQVLAIPESAVVDTGTRKLVYVERMPGMFDGVEVVVGLRCGDAFPLIRGLEPGERVATTGAFLLDAETRLNPSAAASYFGAARRDTAAAGPPASGAPAARGSGAAADPDKSLPPEDRALIARQRLCPVTGKPLGSMGTPVRVVVGNQTVFLCCEGCEAALRKDPAKFLAKLPRDEKR